MLSIVFMQILIKGVVSFIILLINILYSWQIVVTYKYIERVNLQLMDIGVGYAFGCGIKF